MTSAAPPDGASPRWIPMAAMLLAIVALAVGCKTQQSTEFSRTQIAGAIYDDVGQPIPGALIQIARHQAVSDSLGRFRVDAVAPGQHPLSVTAPAHEPHRSSVEIQSRTQFIRVQLHSITGLVAQAITYVEASAWRAVADIANRLEAAAPDDPRTRLLQELVSGSAPLPEGTVP